MEWRSRHPPLHPISLGKAATTTKNWFRFSESFELIEYEVLFRVEIASVIQVMNENCAVSFWQPVFDIACKFLNGVKAADFIQIMMYSSAYISRSA
jgi:hypothetical protein